MRLRIGTGGGDLFMLYSFFGFHKIWGISCLADNRLASQEGLSPMEQVIKVVKDICTPQ